MTLDEAIKHCEEKAKEQREKATSIARAKEPFYKYAECAECAKEHEQLAEWLKELKYIQSSSSYAELTALRKFKADHEKPQSDLISREALKKDIDFEHICNCCNNHCGNVCDDCPISEIEKKIDHAPTVSFSNLSTSNIDELCRLRSDLKSGLHVGSTLRTQTQIDKFVGVLDKVIDNAPTV